MGAAGAGEITQRVEEVVNAEDTVEEGEYIMSAVEMHGVIVRFTWYGRGEDVYFAWNAVGNDRLVSHPTTLLTTDLFPVLVDMRYELARLLDGGQIAERAR